MTTALRHLLWRIKPDPARQAPIRYVQCRNCEEKSPTAAAQAEGDLWAMNHAGRTGHRGYREFAASDLIATPVRGPR
ncbi:DUF7848 domain-containing protein [Streptomyces hydrogenans]|uniref:DUF7848 domain-containing protein n=1 Tax=Streptomyces hydrogenans TaxID=1873719 RepID=UPI0035D54615